MLFSQGSSVHERMARFATRFPDDEFSTIVFSSRAHGVQFPVRIAPNMTAYPTNSWTRLLYGLDAIFRARSVAQPDVVSAQDPFETGLAAWCIARMTRAPLAVEIHTDFLSPAFSNHSLLNQLRTTIAGFVLPRANGGYAVNTKLRDGVVARYGNADSFETLPIFVDTARFGSLPSNPIPGTLLWVGRFAPEKNPELALVALAAATRAGHDVRLTMLGDGVLGSDLRKRVSELGIENRVSFPGWKDPAEYLPQTELMLATSEYEGFGIAIVEALAAGVPVLSTDVGVARAAGAGVVEGDYAGALCSWLEGERSRGTLTLPFYENETEYVSRVHRLYRTLAEKKSVLM